MTREEKMKIVINNYFKTECSVNTSIREAFEKGFRIGASKVQKKPEVGTDTISRQQAIDEIDEWIKAFRENGHKESAADACLIQDGIIQLPPAQPEPCEDAVSREEVLNCLEWQYPDKLPRTKIMELPPVMPKQRTGYWYPVGMAEVVGGESAQWGSAIAYHRCSECDEQALRDDFEQEVLSRWCPHCGAKMVGVYE